MNALPRLPRISRSQQLDRAIAQGRIALNESNKTAVVKTGLVKAYEQSNWNNFTAPVLSGLRRTLGLKAELRALGYTVKNEHA